MTVRRRRQGTKHGNCFRKPTKRSCRRIKRLQSNFTSVQSKLIPRPKPTHFLGGFTVFRTATTMRLPNVWKQFESMKRLAIRITTLAATCWQRVIPTAACAGSNARCSPRATNPTCFLILIWLGYTNGVTDIWTRSGTTRSLSNNNLVSPKPRLRYAGSRAC